MARQSFGDGGISWHTFPVRTRYHPGDLPERRALKCQTQLKTDLAIVRAAAAFRTESPLKTQRLPEIGRGQITIRAGEIRMIQHVHRHGAQRQVVSLPRG